jgi:autophagy-related protein 16
VSPVLHICLDLRVLYLLNLLFCPTQLHQLAGHSHKITCVRLFHNEKEVLTGSADRSMKIWDISRNVYRQTVTFRHSSTSNCLDVSSDSLTAVSGHMDGGLRFWDVRSGDRSAEMAGIHEGGVTSVQFNPADNTKLLTNGRDGTLKLNDVRTCTTIQTFSDPDFRTMSNHVSSALSPDGVYAAAGSGTTGDLFVWRVPDGKLEKKLSAHQSAVCGVSWGRGGTNGQQVASVDKGGVMVLWA